MAKTVTTTTSTTNGTATGQSLFKKFIVGEKVKRAIITAEPDLSKVTITRFAGEAQRQGLYVVSDNFTSKRQLGEALALVKEYSFTVEEWDGEKRVTARRANVDGFTVAPTDGSYAIHLIKPIYRLDLFTGDPELIGWEQSHPISYESIIDRLVEKQDGRVAADKLKMQRGEEVKYPAQPLPRSEVQVSFVIATYLALRGVAFASSYIGDKSEAWLADQLTTAYRYKLWELAGLPYNEFPKAGGEE